MTEAEEPTKQRFEDAMARLEEIVRHLESQELALDQSLALFQEGVGLSRFLKKKLDEAERRIEYLLAGEDQEDGARSDSGSL
ncbi:MAG: exodeoxyribonuclease VII small subunit [Bacillota bacterium]